MDSERRFAKVPETDQLKDAFNSFDDDRSGYLDVDEFLRVIREYKKRNPTADFPEPTEHEVKQMLKSLALESDEKVSFDEFVKMINEVSKKDYEAWVSFTFFDVNGDGTISKEELKKGMKRIGHLHDKKTIKTMMKDADTNGDGLIDFEEFKRMLLIAEQEAADKLETSFAK